MACQLGELGRPWAEFIPSRLKFSNQKLLYFTFSKSSDETFFFSQKINLEDTNLRRRVKTACFQIHNGANGMWNWKKKNKSDIDTFKFHLFQLIFVLHLCYSKIFGNFVSEVTTARSYQASEDHYRSCRYILRACV